MEEQQLQIKPLSPRHRFHNKLGSFLLAVPLAGKTQVLWKHERYLEDPRVQTWNTFSFNKLTTWAPSGTGRALGCSVAVPKTGFRLSEIKLTGSPGSLAFL